MRRPYDYNTGGRGRQTVFAPSGGVERNLQTFRPESISRRVKNRAARRIFLRGAIVRFALVKRKIVCYNYIDFDFCRRENMQKQNCAPINVARWKRRGQFENFIGYDFPVFSVASRIDVTGLTDYCKKSGRSLFTSFLYIVASELNGIEEFRTRISDGAPVLYDAVDPSYVVMYDGDRITGRRTAFTRDFGDFYSRCRADIAEARSRKGFVPFEGSGGCDCFYVSCLPWLDMCSFSNPYNFKDAAQSSIPRITWGKITKEGGRDFVYFDVQAHHALADGFHSAALINNVAAAAANAGAYIGGNGGER